MSETLAIGWGTDQAKLNHIRASMTFSRIFVSRGRVRDYCVWYVMDLLIYNSISGRLSFIRTVGG